MDKGYFGVHNHSEFSNLRLLDSINRPKDLIQTAYNLGLTGIALTDHETLSGHIKFMKASDELKKSGKISNEFKIALGNEIYLTDTRDSGQKYYHFILIAKDAIGHKQLRELSSTAWYYSYSDRGMERVSTLKSELTAIVGSNPGHLIATTACIGGELSTNALGYALAKSVGDEVNANHYYLKMGDFWHYCKGLFGDDFYIECAPSNAKDQCMVNRTLWDFAREHHTKMVVGTDAHYLTAADREVHKAYLNSKGGEREVDSFYEFAHLMDWDEAFTLLHDNSFYDYNELWNGEITEEILKNTLEIQDKISDYSLFHKQDIPTVEVANYPKKYWITVNGEGEDNPDYPHLSEMLHDDDVQNRYWVNQCLDKLYELGKIDGPDSKKYLDELEEEARVKTVISGKLETNMFRYPNTLQHYIDLIWDCGSMVGAGRGSSCAALNHYLMGITQLDPIEWNLPFFRYLNDERIELGSLILILPSCK